MLNELVEVAVQAAPAQLPSITVQNGGILGNTTAAGIGILLFYFSRRFAKSNKLIWKPGGKVSTWGKDKGIDVLSIISFVIGFLAITMVLGAPDNPARTVIEWSQALFTRISENSILAMFGAGGICLGLGLLAYAKDTDCPKDMFWGGLCAVIFPLGGGMFSTISLTMAGIASGSLAF